MMNVIYKPLEDAHIGSIIKLRDISELLKIRKEELAVTLIIRQYYDAFPSIVLHISTEVSIILLSTTRLSIIGLNNDEAIVTFAFGDVVLKP